MNRTACLLLLLSSWIPVALTGCDGGIAKSVGDDDSGDTDLDGDGFTGEDDCNEEDPDIYVGAPEICDGKDNDCDAAVDGSDPDLADGVAFYPDVDLDSYGDSVGEVIACEAPDGYVEVGGDCDDQNDAVHPDGTEQCGTAADDDCDGSINDADAVGCTTWYADADGDGFGADEGASACLCFGDDDFPASVLGDCDDTNDGIHPDAEEICSDGIDQDCDGDWEECRVFTPMPVTDAGFAIRGVRDESAVGLVVTAGPDFDGDGTGDLFMAGGGAQGTYGYVFLNGVTVDSTVASADVSVIAASSGTISLPRLVHDLDGDGQGELVALPTDPFTAEVTLARWSGPATGNLTLSDASLSLSGFPGTRAWSDAQSLTIDGVGSVLLLLEPGVSAVALNLQGAGSTAYLSAIRAEVLTPNVEGMAILPDVDGDGFDEVAAMIPNVGAGSVRVLLSGDVATTISTENESFRVAGEVDGDDAGAAVSGAGDLNNDGYGDFLIGAPRHNDTASNSGTVYIFYGEAVVPGARTGAEADAELAGELRNDYAGTSVAEGGDLDGDGNLDILIGAIGFDAGGNDNPGAAYAVYGPISGFATLNDHKGRVAGTSTGSALGTALAGPVDLDGDGYNEFIVGEPYHDTAGDTNAGAVWVVPGAGL